MDKIAKDQEDAARGHYSLILYCHVNKLREHSQSEVDPGKDRIGDKIIDKKRIKQVMSRTSWKRAKPWWSYMEKYRK